MAVVKTDMMEAGTVALDGTNPTTVTTGLKTITNVVLTLVGSSAPGDATHVLTYTVSAGVISIYAWAPVSGTDPTLAASTGTETVSWIAFGTR